MEKVVKWIMKHRKCMLGLMVAIIFLPMLVIHLLFKIQSGNHWIESEWGAGEVLGYFGDVLSFIGTVTLGYVAIAQTEKANQLNSELLKIEKNRIKPCFDISCSQLYKIYLAEKMNEKINELNRNKVMVMDILYTSNPRTGIETSSALIELEVTNSGFSDIRRLFVEKVLCYLSVSDPNNSNNEKISIMCGDTSLKSGESKKIYIHFKREFFENEDLSNNWYKENIGKLMPRLQFELKLETVSGEKYYEKISCGSSWDSSMKNESEIATRAIGITDVSVDEISE